jgi:hypothetical protein
MKAYLLLLGSLCVLAGCQGLKRDGAGSRAGKLPWSSQKAQKDVDPTPAQVVAIWSDAVYDQVGRPSVRGFGGRVYFYNAQNDAVAVDGQLVVYAYDDSGRGEPSQVPTRKFVFTAEQLSQQYSPTDLGPCYNIWLPWDEVGGFKTTVTLLPVFTGTSGGAATGSQSVSVLPGKSPPEPEVRKKGHFTTLSGQSISSIPGISTIQPASHERTVPSAGSWQYAHPAQGPEMRTTTIGLPMATSQRLVEQAAVTPRDGALPANSDLRPLGAPPSSEANGTSGGAAEATERPPPVRFERPRYQVPRATSALPARAHAALPPAPATRLPGPPSLP